VTAKYVTLTTKAIPLKASPGNSALPGVAGVSATTPVATPTPSPTPDDRTPLPELTLHSWQTPVQRPGILIVLTAMIISAMALIVTLYLRNLRASGGTAAMRRKRRIAELWSQLASESSEAAVAYDAAVEYASLVAPPSEGREELIAKIGARRDLLKYGRGVSSPLNAEERENLIATLKKLSSR
jgi:cell division protein FtsL